MKIILIKDVPKVGQANTVVNVAPGYARNFLLPRRLAIPATPEALKELERKFKRLEEELAKEKTAKEEIKKKLESQEIPIQVEAGESGKLFGTVTSQNVSDSIRELTSIDVDKKNIELEEPIKTVGEHEVTVRLHPEVVARVKVKVEAEVK